MVNTTKKRKAEELEVSLDGNSNPQTDHKSAQLTNRPIADSDPVHPQLPAPVWGHVFDYMPYQEARSALLIGKLIANEAAKYVTTLNIMRCCELYVRAARRFANVEEVNIFCLLKHESDDVQVLSADAASRTVPFISTFDVLKNVFVGGWKHRAGRRAKPTRSVYNASLCLRPENHREIMRGLIVSLCGAFKAGVFSQHMQHSLGKIAYAGRDRLEGTLHGISSSIEYVRPCRDVSDIDGYRSATREEDPARPCSWCREVCKVFPMSDVMFDPYNRHFCLRRTEVFQIISSRDDGVSFLEKNAVKILLFLLREAMSLSHVSTIKRLAFEAKYAEYRECWFPSSDKDFVYYVSDKSFEEIGEVIDLLRKALGTLPQIPLVELKHKCVWFKVWTKSGFERIFGLLGMPAGDPEDYAAVTLDDSDPDPIMEELRKTIRGECLFSFDDYV